MTTTIGCVLAFALGYVAGSRAGRERYEQLTEIAGLYAAQFRGRPVSRRGSVDRRREGRGRSGRAAA